MTLPKKGGLFNSEIKDLLQESTGYFRMFDNRDKLMVGV